MLKQIYDISFEKYIILQILIHLTYKLLDLNRVSRKLTASQTVQNSDIIQDKTDEVIRSIIESFQRGRFCELDLPPITDERSIESQVISSISPPNQKPDQSAPVEPVSLTPQKNKPVTKLRPLPTFHFAKNGVVIIKEDDGTEYVVRPSASRYFILQKLAVRGRRGVPLSEYTGEMDAWNRLLDNGKKYDPNDVAIRAMFSNINTEIFRPDGIPLFVTVGFDRSISQLCIYLIRLGDPKPWTKSGKAFYDRV